MSPKAYLVEVELKRVQTFLFRVPRLRSMMGANVLLGEAIRVTLADIAARNGALPVSNLLKESEEISRDCESIKKLDPFDASGIAQKHKDDPVSLRGKGILSREGGHFSALFPARDMARAFQEMARDKLTRDLEGLPFETRIKALCGEELIIEREDELSDKGVVSAPLDLPLFQVCQESGSGPAHRRIDRDDGAYISEHVQRLEVAAEKLKNHQSHDIAGLLWDQLPLTDQAKGLAAPSDFKELCNNGHDYLAVIVADGNDMGKRSKEWVVQKTGVTKRSLIGEMWRESFFHWARVCTRKAVKDALYETFKDYRNKASKHLKIPYQLLMLGGDDLLMVCRARYALDFVVEYAKHIEEQSLEGYPRMTVGIGVAIASHDFPFYRLHELAESLASSAKILGRTFPEESKHSVVDWMVSTYSWSDDPLEMRRAHEKIAYKVRPGNACEDRGGRFRSETLILTGRPYKVLSDSADTTGKCDLQSLKGLLQAAGSIRPSEATDGNRKVARSQLRYLVDQLHRGRLRSELSFTEMPKDTRVELNNVLGPELWRRFPGRDDEDRHVFLTSLADLVELTEIPNLAAKEDTERQEHD